MIHFIFLNSSSLFQVVLVELMREILPEITEHFKGVPGGLAMVIFQWLQTLLVGAVPSHTLLRIWDLLVVGMYVMGVRL